MDQDAFTRQRLMERRRFKRYSYDTRIWLEENDGDELIKLATLNISAGGVLFLSQTNYPVGKRMRILIELPFFLDLVEAETSVRHVNHEPAGDYMVGLNLEYISGITERGLHKFLNALMDRESTGDDISSSLQDTIPDEDAE